MNVLLFPTAEVAFGMLNPWYRLDADLREKIVLLGSFAGVTVLLVLWALFIRKRRPRRSRHGFPASSSSALSREAEGNSAGERPRKVRRRRRRDPRPRNPTLAETRGLPPLRQEPPETAF